MLNAGLFTTGLCEYSWATAMRPFPPLASLIAVLAHCAVGALCVYAASGPQWKAGVAVVDITPGQPVWMGGYAARKKPSEGVARHLHAKALVLEDARGRRAVIITSDLLGFRRAVAEPIAQRIGKKHGLSRDAILFNSSHTHSGPVVGDMLIDMYPLDEAQKAAVRDYCNDVFAYIASKRVVEEGGYEAADSMIYYGQPGPWSPQAEDALVMKVHALVKKVRAR